MKAPFVLIFTLLAIAACDDGGRQVRFDKQSAFERVLVVDQGSRRYLRFGDEDGANQSIASLSDPAAVPSEYIRISTLAVVLTPKMDRALMLGLGGGTYTTFLHRHFPKLTIDAVEIDPVVVEAAKGFFGVKEDGRLRVHIADGARFIRKTPDVYSLLMLDAYSGQGLPRALSSPSFFESVGAKTAEDGVVVLNLFKLGSRERSLVEVFQKRFPHTACIRTADGLNLVVFGKTAGMPARAEVIEAAGRFTEAADLSFDLGLIAADLDIGCSGGGRPRPAE